VNDAGVRPQFQQPKIIKFLLYLPCFAFYAPYRFLIFSVGVFLNSLGLVIIGGSLESRADSDNARADTDGFPRWKLWRRPGRVTMAAERT
jgi:hypothetical protein